MISFIKNLKLKFKLFFLISPFLIIILITTSYFFVSLWKDIQDARTVISFIHFSEEIGSLIHFLQKERGMSVTYLGSQSRKKTSLFTFVRKV